MEHECDVGLALTGLNDFVVNVVRVQSGLPQVCKINAMGAPSVLGILEPFLDVWFLNLDTK